MEIQTEFEDIKPLKFFKHSTTRWLSLERCVKRLIEKWPALYAYFDRETSSGTNIERAEKNCHTATGSPGKTSLSFYCLCPEATK